VETALFARHQLLRARLARLGSRSVELLANARLEHITMGLAVRHAAQTVLHALDQRLTAQHARRHSF